MGEWGTLQEKEKQEGEVEGERMRVSKREGQESKRERKGGQNRTEREV